tara:strand:+ start:71 stop:739 length:669 start_codon:yes stop_codon:yes gene_type:complete
MAIALKRTGSTNQYVNMLVYGQSGAGKTTLCSTIDNIIILSAEGGLLSLPEGIPYLEIQTVEDLYEAYEFITTGEGKDYTTVCIDSLTEIAEVVLADEKDKVADARQAYMKMGDIMNKLIRSFRDLDKNTIVIAKAEKDKDESGKILWSPMMPGAKFAQSIPYHFDEVLALRVEKDEQGKNVHMLQTHNDGLWSAKSRSNKLADWEEPHIGKIIAKIQGEVK